MAHPVDQQTHRARKRSALSAAAGRPAPLVFRSLDVGAEPLRLLHHFAHVAQRPAVREGLILRRVERFRLRSLRPLDDLQIVVRLRRLSSRTHSHRDARRGQKQYLHEKRDRNERSESQTHCASCQVCSRGRMY